MTPTITEIPLNQIWFDALARDRTAVMMDEMAELRSSILRDGLRQPIEVYALAEDPTNQPDADDDPETAALIYGLISGCRRLTVFTEMNDDFPGKFETIPAIIRPFTSRADSLRKLVEENDLHAAIYPWDTGNLIIETVRDKTFPTVDAASAALFPSVSPAKRTRLRAFAHVVDMLGELMTLPHGLSQQKMLRLAAGLRDNWTDLIQTTLRDSGTENPDRQWSMISAILTEAESELKDMTHVDPRPGRPRRSADIREGVRLRREKTMGGYALHFTGRMVSSGYMDDVIDQLEIWFGRRE